MSLTALWNGFAQPDCVYSRSLRLAREDQVLSLEGSAAAAAGRFRKSSAHFMRPYFSSQAFLPEMHPIDFGLASNCPVA